MQIRFLVVQTMHGAFMHPLHPASLLSPPHAQYTGSKHTHTHTLRTCGRNLTTVCGAQQGAWRGGVGEGGDGAGDGEGGVQLGWRQGGGRDAAHAHASLVWWW